MIKFQKFVDKYLGGILCLLLWAIGLVFFFMPKRKSIQKIAVIRLWAIGEALLTLPMIHELRKKYPKAEITLIARKRVLDVFYKNKDISNIILFEPNNLGNVFRNFKRFDVAIDTEPWLRISAILGFWLAPRRIGFGGTMRSILYTDKVRFRDDQHAVLNFMDLSAVIGAYSMPEKLVDLKYDSKNKENVENFLRKNKISGKDLIIGVCPAGIETTASRAWPKDRFAKLADLLVKNFNAKIIMVGSPKEKDYIDDVIGMMKSKALSSAGIFSLKDLFYFTEICTIFISNDTGPMHIAAAQGCPTLGIFGPETPVKYGPYGPKNAYVYKKLDCSPCLVGWKGKVQECTRKDIKSLCMKKIEIDDVYSVAERMLKK